MSGISKFISAIVVLLLLIGLAFGIYSFVDSSKKGNERLSDKTTQQEKKKDDKDKKEKKDKKSVEEKKNNTQQTQQVPQTQQTQQTQQTVQTPQRPTTQTPEKREQKNQKLMKEKKLDKTVQILKKAQMKKINRQHNKSHNKINLTSHQRIVKVPKINQIKHSQPDHKTMEIVAIKMLVRGRTHKNKIITIKILKAQKRINKK